LPAQPEEDGVELGKEGGGLPSTPLSADAGREQHGVEAVHMSHSGWGPRVPGKTVDQHQEEGAQPQEEGASGTTTM
jgi:hypothetical protein